MNRDWLAVFEALKAVYSDGAFSNISIIAPALGSVLGRFRKIYDLMLAGCALVSVLFLLTVGLLSRGAVSL